MFIGEQTRLTGMPCVACIGRKKVGGLFLLRMFDYAVFFFGICFLCFFFLGAMRYSIIAIKELVYNPN